MVKRRGKQFRRSLKTTDCKLAERRLADVRHKVERLARPDDANRTFEEVAGHWVDLTAGGLKPWSLDRRRTAHRNTLTVTGGEAGTKNHEFRHFFAATCIEAGVDIPTVARRLGHKDGGALAMRVYGHLRQEHSLRQGRVAC